LLGQPLLLPLLQLLLPLLMSHLAEQAPVEQQVAWLEVHVDDGLRRTMQEHQR
jgi:hypothetical protein